MSSPPLRTLLIDNYDSYTYNLYHLIAEVNGEPPVVITNDELSWEELSDVLADQFDSVVLSPGPGTPHAAQDVGVCRPLLAAAAWLPVLGVCLGHQALGAAHGARVVRAPEAVHGRLSAVTHNGHPLFAAIPSGALYTVVRYHSLAVEPGSLPKCLAPLAWAADGVLMALAHRERPHFGVQFHPESCATSFGAQLLKNYGELARVHLAASSPRQQSAGAGPWRPPGYVGPLARTPAALAAAQPRTRLSWRRLPLGAQTGTEPLFWACIAPTQALERDTWWLDSASTDHGRARFSFMGGRGGPLWRRATFRLDEPGAAPCGDGTTGILTLTRADGTETRRRAAFLDYVEAELAQARCAVEDADLAALPFDFWGGWVGYFGYEMRAECMPSRCARRHRSGTPDAALFFADRLLAVDHATGDAYALALLPPGDATAALEAGAWMDDMQARAAAAAAVVHKPPAAVPAPPCCAPAPPAVWEGAAADAPPGAFSLLRGRGEYVADVRSCQEAIASGETYEVCLTTQLQRQQGRLQPRAMYSTLRARNPAPYAAWLRVGGGCEEEGPDELALCCSSPERFLRLDRHRVLEAKPIKGTCARVEPLGCPADCAAGRALQASPKERAENLMIVDLLRNDMGRVCRLGSVQVPLLCALESFAAVHQLVSTVRGALLPGLTAVAALRCAFPGGSMTGAPKLRTCDLVDGLEACARGPYAGALGYLSASGPADLNIVIRTALLHRGKLSVGAGGAVTALSDAQEEYAEMRLKAARVLAAVAAADAA